MMRRFVAALAGFIMISCSDNPAAPAIGRIDVTIEILGRSLDRDGLEIVLEGQTPARVVGTRWLRHLWYELPYSSYRVHLNGLAENCMAEGGSSRVVSLESEAKAVHFTVTCAGTGVDVTLDREGTDFPFAFDVKIGNQPARRISLDETLQVDLEPGQHSVMLTGLLENCIAEGPTVRTVDVKPRDIVPITFAIACSRTPKQMAFVLDTVVNYRAESWIMTADEHGRNIVPIARGRNPVWGPDGRITYSAAECDYYYGTCTGGLETIDPETRSVAVLEHGSAGLMPSWSPDGKLLAFTSVHSGTALLALGANGPTAFRVDGFNARHATWSPDGKRLAFECLTEINRTRICVVDYAAGTPVALTHEPYVDTDPAWTPAGDRIAFTTTRFGTGPSIALMNPDGTEITRVTAGCDPTWSPDAARLIFCGFDGLYSISPDGTQLQRLTTGIHRSPAMRPK